ncbi:unnamed protein product [Cuscuta campestris]|uniref:Uncharacterized protein n=1 Tax=Cuscuta campestris TaxID=132261 RepID=A0A484MEL3_9ASTE|nr:unnamed protein product [Cuscuta campestris]
MLWFCCWKVLCQIDYITPPNKACPCGSKKKYKSCCGSAAGKSYAKLITNQTADNGKKGQKDKRQGKKGKNVNVAAGSNHQCAELPDMGALCI